MTETPISHLAQALAAAQSEMKNPAKNQENPHFKAKFADLAALRDATLPALVKHGLSIHHETRIDDGNLILVCKLEHVSGETRESCWPLPHGKPQELGSALTYGRRYTWSAMCGVAAEEDDDGQAASSTRTTAKRSATSPSPSTANGSGSGRSGASEAPPETSGPKPSAPEPDPLDRLRRGVWAEAANHGWRERQDEFKALIYTRCGVDSFRDLDEKQLHSLLADLKSGELVPAAEVPS